MHNKDNSQENLNRMKAEALTAEKGGRYFEASILYKNLLGEASKCNDSELIAEAKSKMVEMNGLSKDEFKEISVERQIPTEEIEESIKHILGEGSDMEEVLARIGQHPHLYPKKKEIEESSKKNVSLFRLLASNHSITEDNHALGGKDQQYIKYMDDYGIDQSVIMQVFMGRIFDDLKNKYGFTLETLQAYFAKKRIFSPEDSFFIESGLRNFFADDYCAAIHILVPRFEKCFIELSKLLGINTISLKRTKKGIDDVVTSGITLSVDVLRKSEFTDVWSEDFCEHIVYVFYERLGYGLRHKVAHGTLSVVESNKAVCELIIYFYLVLASRIRIEDKTNE